VKVRKVDPGHNDPTAKVYRGLRERDLLILDLEKRLDKTSLIHVEEESFGIIGQETGWARVTGRAMAKIREQPWSGM
jgi:hypothetical protein